ncbi:MAG: hypothetical protein ACKV19_05305 [Verrucomicrobiales bacterium]
MNNSIPAANGEAILPSGRMFAATFSNVRPGFTTLPAINYFGTQISQGEGFPRLLGTTGSLGDDGGTRGAPGNPNGTNGVNRTPERGRQLLDTLVSKLRCQAELIHWSSDFVLPAGTDIACW